MLSLLILFLSHTVQAEIGYSLESYQYIQKSQVAETGVNPDNQILKEPYLAFNLDVRGELKWKNDNSQAVLRPRFEGYITQADYGNNETYRRNGSLLDLTDAFFQNNWGDFFSTTVGLQVYQWGPAEIMNPSNSLFHFFTQQRSVLYKEKGQVLLRANYLLNAENNLVFIVEPISNNRSEWLAENTFVPKLLLKYEKSWNGTADQIGFVVGSAEKRDLYFGQYWNWMFVDGYSFYGDVKQSEKPLNYEPQQNGVFIDFASAERKAKWDSLAVVGLRYEGDFDVRAEYIYNQAGFSDQQYQAALASVKQIVNPNYVQNLTRFKNIGLELLLREYIYFSYRVAEPFNWNQLNLYARQLSSVRGRSSQTQVEFDKSLGDSIGLFGGMTVADGESESELRLLNDWSFFAGFKWSL
jgi:hypothetical protein